MHYIFEDKIRNFHKNKLETYKSIEGPTVKNEQQQQENNPMTKR